MQLHIVLVEPEIPQNTGNIARTCAATGAILHLVKPYGFSIDEKHVRRAGLDYWPLVNIKEYAGLEEFLKEHGGAPLFFFSTKAPRSYTEITYPKETWLVFGRETKGLPEDILATNYEQCVRIPMRDAARSLNLSNSVAVAAYEVLRQQEFPGLSAQGHLTSQNAI